MTFRVLPVISRNLSAPRLLALSLILIATTVLPLAPPFPAPPASAKPAASLVNSGFENGARGWQGSPRTRLASSRDGRTGKALRVRTSRRAAAVIRNTRVMASSARAGTRHRAVAWVRTNRSQAVRLVVRERRNGRVVQQRRTTRVVAPQRWTRLRVTLPTRHPNARLRLRIGSKQQRPGARLLIDDVSLRALGSSGSGGRCGPHPRGVPQCGTYLGAAYGANSDPAGWERELGGRLALRRTYFRADQVEGAVRHARSDLAHGRLPWISFKLPHSWEQMASGAGDAWARDLAARLAGLPGPVWVAFHHEPEGDGDMAAWRRMQERLGPIVRQRAPNVAFTVIVTGWHQFYGESRYSLDRIWPRGIAVDVAGFDIYNTLGVVKDGVENVRGNDLRRDYFTRIKAWADAEGVAWGLAETGYTHRAAEQDPRWIQRTFNQMQNMGGVAFAYFNTRLNSIAPWDISTAVKQRDFAAALSGSTRMGR